MKNAVGSLFIAVLILCTGSVSVAGVYQDNVLSGPLFKKDVNHEYVKKLAAESGDIYSFIRKVYESRKIWDDARNSIPVYQTRVPTINQIFSNNTESEDQFAAGIGENDFDRKIYADYCSEKEGSLFYWDNRTGLVGYRFYVCEITGIPDSFQIIESSSANTLKPSVRHWFGYGDGKKFRAISEKLFRFQNASGEIKYSHLEGSRFSIQVNYPNNTNRPISIDLSKIRLIQDGAEYDAEYVNRKNPYFGQDGPFVKLNPRQSFTGETVITVQGLSFDNRPISLIIGSTRYDNFIKIYDYEAFKKKLF